MIVVEVKFVPPGIAPKIQMIGVLKIWDDTADTSEEGSYRYVCMKDGDVTAWGNLRNSPRQEKDAWDLIREVLNGIHL